MHENTDAGVVCRNTRVTVCYVSSSSPPVALALFFYPDISTRMIFHEKGVLIISMLLSNEVWAAYGVVADTGAIGSCSVRVVF
jgi:hypothetical protein